MPHQVRYHYTNGKIRSVDTYNASTRMHAFNYGTAAFEGLRAYYQKKENNWYIFRADQHYRRLCRSASMIDIKIDFSFEDFARLLVRLIKKNYIKTDVYLRPLVYRNALGVGLAKPPGYGLAVSMEPMPFRPLNKYSACFVTQRRPVDGSYNVKLSGNYLLSFLAQKEAARKGFDLGLLLSSDGFISEASVMNIFFVNGGSIFTPGLQCGPLDGITRKSVIKILKNDFNLGVRCGKYRAGRLYSADEVFTTGTGSGINLIDNIENREVPYSRSTGMAAEVYRTYKKIVYGRSDNYREWLYPVN